MTNPLLTLENIRSGAVPSDAVAVGFLLGEIERLKRALRNCADYADYPQDGADIGRKVRLNGVADVCAVALRGSLEPRVCVVDGFACEATQRCEDCPHPDACEAAGGCDTPAQKSEDAPRGAGSETGI